MDLGTIIKWGFIIGVVIIPITIWVIFIIYKRKNKITFLTNLSGLLIVCFFWTFFVFKIFPGSNEYFSKKRVKEMTGIEIRAKRSVLYDSFGGFQGDGYTIMQYEIKGNIPRVDLTTLKKPKNSRSRWTSNDWKETPLLQKDSIYIRQLLAETSNNSDSIQLAQAFNVITEILESEGNFYTYSGDFIKDSDYWYGLTFYVLSTKKRLIITINCQI